ncbi:MAG TPA: tetratricopeptide repeat protein [Chitinophagaceae bacterium]|nr:tetratricopeptide repeat protein [Chitinophagaceae bacterium]
MKKDKKKISKKSARPDPVASKDFKKQEKFIVNHKVGIILGLIAFVLYSNTIGFGYVLDDSAAIVENQFVKKGIAGIPDLLKTDFWYFSNLHLGYYRPLALITFAIEQQFFNGNPQISHFVNVLIYAFTAYMLFIVLSRIFRTRNFLFPLIISLFFIAHPVHTEVVANIKSRDELLSFLNVLLMLWFSLKYTDLKKTFDLFAGLFFFYLALLSKETAFVAILFLPAIFYFRGSYSIMGVLKKTIPYLFIIALFLIQKNLLLENAGGMTPDDPVNYPYRASEVRIPMAFLLFAFGLKLLLFPHPLRYDYSFNQIPAAGISNVFVIAGIILFIAGAVTIIKYYKSKSPIILGLVILYVSMAPLMAFTFLRGGIFAERFLFFPSLGFSIAIVSALSALLKTGFTEKIASLKTFISSNIVFFLLTLSIAVLYSIKTFSRNFAWKDEITLFSTDIESGQNCTQNLRHYGTEIMRLAIKEKDQTKKNQYATTAINTFKRALVIHPKFGECLNQIGVIFQEVYLIPDSAMYYYTKAIEASPGLAFPSYNLGTIYQLKGNNEAASFYYNEAIKKNPAYQNAITAKENLKKATGMDVQINPLTTTVDTTSQIKNGQYYYNLGNYYASRGNYTKAAELFQQSINLDASIEDAYINLANSYGMLKEYEKSIKISEQLLQRNPNNLKALENLAVTYRSLGNNKKAEEYLTKANTLRNQ